ncbi:segmentation protein cap'n'collar-like [Oppia nitens]|uniref:segmentation protein cap'n'collar-like n=1 Tax=Oppia nitens TaxID=1686743 RepID=UPI0023DADD37|nr:segmentation protein cap'n'collar-like [Oppia nitens]
MCSLATQSSSLYVLPHNQNQNQILSRITKATNSDILYTDGWQTSGSHIYPSNISSLLPVSGDSQDIHSSIYYESNGSTNNGDNRLAPIDHNGYELNTIYNPSTIVVPSGIGAALISSMATLANGSEVMPEMACSVAYASDINDMVYVNNGSTHISPQNGSEYMVNEYLSEEDMHLIEMSNVANQSVSNYHLPSHHYNQHHNQTMVTNNNEDIMDASSDSAVSSMSSERIQSLSDNEWIDTCSETSSHNGDPHHSDYSTRMASNGYRIQCNTNSAQKKYKLFGRKIECKEEPYERPLDVNQHNQQQQHSHPHPHQLNSNNPTYSDAFTSGLSDNYGYQELSQQTQQNHNLLINGQPVSSVIHNHAYHISNVHNPELSSIASVANMDAMAAIHQQWLNTKNSLNNDSNGNNNRQRKLSLESDGFTSEMDQQLNRDEKRAKALKIPIPTLDIINLPIDEFNERLAKYELNEAQLSLIRDIRRRGKNKVAAQNCRKRKLDQILGLQHEVDNMFVQKHSLESLNDQLLMLRDMAREKYSKLYHFILEVSTPQPSHYESSVPLPDYPNRQYEQNMDSLERHESLIVTNCETNSETKSNTITEMQINFQNENIDKNV